MFCQNCGKELFGSTANCPYCNAPVNNTVNNYSQNQTVPPTNENTATGGYILNGQAQSYTSNQQQTQYQSQNQYQYNNQYQGAYQPQQPTQTPFTPNYNQNTVYNGYGNIKDIESAKTMGIVSVVLAIFGLSIIGLIVAIVGSGKIKPIFFANSADTNTRSAYNWNKAGIIANVLRLVFAILLIIVYVGVISSSVAEGTDSGMAYSMSIIGNLFI